MKKNSKHNPLNLLRKEVGTKCEKARLFGGAERGPTPITNIWNISIFAPSSNMTTWICTRVNLSSHIQAK